MVQQIALSRSAQTSSWKRPPVILFLKATTSNERPLILFILDGQLWEAKLYFPFCIYGVLNFVYAYRNAKID